MGFKKCFFCGQPANSKEHLPPQQMFKGFHCDSITVPSCELHNSKKSTIDQSIIHGFLIPLSNLSNPDPDILRAIEVAKDAFFRTKRKATESPLLKNFPFPLDGMPNTYLIPEIDINSWIRLLTAGLVFYVTKNIDPQIQWSKVNSWSPNFINTLGPHSIEPHEYIQISKQFEDKKKSFDKLNWKNGWSAHPRPYPSSIYYFEVSQDNEGRLGFKHVFYKNYSWYIFFSAHEETILKIRTRLVN